MDGYGLFEDWGRPMRGERLQALKKFLSLHGLGYDGDIDTTVAICDNKNDIIAAGSLSKNIMKCIAVSTEHRGEGLLSRLATLLLQEAYARHYGNIFLYTRPDNLRKFRSLGFCLLASEERAVFMQYGGDGIKKYLEKIPAPKTRDNGAIVLNASPFTNGHRYLAETAAKQCEQLFLFVVSEETQPFSFRDRMALVKAGVSDLENVTVYPSSEFMLSAASFPTYFLKDSAEAGEINCMLDLDIFCRYFAPHFAVTKRFVGTEPECRVTAMYNDIMKGVLPSRGVGVCEVSRLTEGGECVSASRVREFWRLGDFDALRRIVPKDTYQFLKGARPPRRA